MIILFLGSDCLERVWAYVTYVFAEMAKNVREEKKEQYQPMTSDDGNNGKIAMKRQLGLMNGIAMIVGINDRFYCLSYFC